MSDDRARIGIKPDVSLARRLSETAALIAALRECSDELAEWVEAHYKGSTNFPSEERRRKRDMEPVERARALLARLADDGEPGG